MLWLLCSFVACVLHFYLPCTSCGWVPPDHRLFCLQGLSSSLLLVLADFCLLEKKIHKILPKDFHIGWYYLFLLSTFWVEKSWKMCFFQPNNCHFWIDYWLRSWGLGLASVLLCRKHINRIFFIFMFSPDTQWIYILVWPMLPHPQLIFPFKTWFFGIYLNFQRQKSLKNQ